MQYVTIDYVIIDTMRGRKVHCYLSSYRVGVLNVAGTARKQKRSKESMCHYFEINPYPTNVENRVSS